MKATHRSTRSLSRSVSAIALLVGVLGSAPAALAYDRVPPYAGDHEGASVPGSTSSSSHHDGLEVRFGSGASAVPAAARPERVDGLEVRFGSAPAPAPVLLPATQYDGLEVRFGGQPAVAPAPAPALDVEPTVWANAPTALWVTLAGAALILAGYSVGHRTRRPVAMP